MNKVITFFSLSRISVEVHSRHCLKKTDYEVIFIEDTELFQNETSSKIPLEATSGTLTRLSLLKSNVRLNNK